MGDVTTALGTLDTDLGTADSTWETDMGTAGAALGSALDGIADFDWSNVTTYITTVTNARRGAETSVLNAQLGFVTSYYSALGAYTGSMATAGVTHATAYAQATADYYVNSSAAAAAANPGDATLAARAAAFAAFATSYVSNITTATQNAANAATTAQANANAASLATLTAEVTTATNAINEFYDDVVADNASPPPVDTDADDDGIPDPVTPSASQTTQGQINVANAENATTRATIQSSLSPLTTARTTSTTNTYAALTETTTNTNTNQQQGAPLQYGAAPPAGPVGPSGLAQNNSRFQIASSSPPPGDGEDTSETSSSIPGTGSASWSLPDFDPVLTLESRETPELSPGPIIPTPKTPAPDVPIRGDDPPLFITGNGDLDAISPNDPEQYSLPHCSVYAALMAVAASRPDLLRQRISANSDGSFTVTLYSGIKSYSMDSTILLASPQSHTRDLSIDVLAGEIDSRANLGGDIGSSGVEMWVRVYQTAFVKHVNNGDWSKGFSIHTTLA